MSDTQQNSRELAEKFDTSKWTFRQRFNAIWNRLNHALHILHCGDSKQAEAVIIETREWANEGVSIAYRQEQEPNPKATELQSLLERVEKVERIELAISGKGCYYSEEICVGCDSADKHRPNCVIAVLEQRDQLAKDKARLVEACRPITNCVTNEIRWTEDNTHQFFYNFVPTGPIRLLAALLKEME